jgi:hypothetical protein
MSTEPCQLLRSYPEHEIIGSLGYFANAGFVAESSHI